MKRILIISGWVALVAGTVVLLGFAASKRNNTTCKSVDIVISHNDNALFITPQQIDTLITGAEGELKGKTMNRINLKQIEQLLKDNPYIADAQVFATLDGNIKIKIAQRDPIARIINTKDESYYIDSSGSFMPLSEDCTPRVLVLNGAIGEAYALNYKRNAKQMARDTSVHSVLPSIYKIAAYISRNPFWKAQITQVYIDTAKEFILIPRVGGQRILFGDTSSLKEKFDKLLTLYTDGFNYNGKWNEYSTINLKYKHQIVCTKK
jgi:cell division protein FtsQ